MDDVKVSDMIPALLPLAETIITESARSVYEALTRARLEDAYDDAEEAALAAGEEEAAATAALREAEEQIMRLHLRLVPEADVPPADDDSISPEARVGLLSHRYAAQQHNTEVRERITLTEQLLDLGRLNAAHRQAEAASRRAVKRADAIADALGHDQVLSTPAGMRTPEGRAYTRLILAITSHAHILTDMELAARERAAVDQYVHNQALADSVQMVEAGPGFDAHLSGEPIREIWDATGLPLEWRPQ